MKVPILDLKKEYKIIQSELEPRILECLRSGMYIGGTQVSALEKELAEYLGVKHAITVSSGTDALMVALKAIGIRSGDEVITTPFTFFATAEAISAVGGVPVFADVCEDTLNIDPNTIEDKITSRTKAILPVHIFGQAAKMEEINAIAKKHHLRVIEDACQAIGAEYKGRKVGGIGDLGCFSFFPTKNLGAFGDAGLVATDDDSLATICRAVKEHGGGKIGAEAKSILEGKKEQFDVEQVDPLYNPYKYYNYLIGYNSRLDALQAVVLRVKLKYLDQWNANRAKNARYYREHLKDADVVLPAVDKDASPIWHQFVIKTRCKQELGDFLSQKGITTGAFYPVPLHLQKAFEDLGYQEGSLPVVEKVTKQTLCLPIFPELTEEELAYVVDTIKAFKN